VIDMLDTEKAALPFILGCLITAFHIYCIWKLGEIRREEIKPKKQRLRIPNISLELAYVFAEPEVPRPKEVAQ